LEYLLKALKGIVVMSGEFEQMADSLYDNQVPLMGKMQVSHRPNF
jgi:hypothetical protein